jgi:hypothetical protein
MKYLIIIIATIPCCLWAQIPGIYLDSTGKVAIANDTVWEPFQVFTLSAGDEAVLDQESAEIGNSSGLLITQTVISAQSFTCGLSGELLTVSGRMATAATGGNSNLVLRLREGSLPGGTLITSQTFSVTGEVMQWYDVDREPGTFVEAGDSLFLVIQVTSGGKVGGDWLDSGADI